MIHTFIGNMGHLFVIISFVMAIFSAFSFFKATNANAGEKQEWLRNGRIFYYIHAIAVFGIVASLFTIISNHYFEYHYAWSHSSTQLPPYYMVSAFWEGQEGSFLLWMFWHAVLGIVIIATNKFWEAPVMAIFTAVQAFLASMILGVVIPALEFKIGSSPFILLRDALDAPIFQQNPDFVPQDGTGLNPLLQNYWMVIHPPTLFLGFALTVVPFAYCMAGLWLRKYRDWVRPALPWSLFAGAVLGLGILMGGYWAYETLNFGGYWNWDPVENAVYVPWLFLIAAIHTMISFRKSNTALKASIILTVIMYVLVLYSTFLTRSGILGEASVHSFTDLGMSGQLLLYLLFFMGVSLYLMITRWKELPTTDREASVYSREFWLFIGALTLCLMGFQVIFSTSFPVINRIVEAFGGVSNLAPLAPEKYSTAQLWFSIGVALLSAVGQYFYWKKIDRKKLFHELSAPFIIALILTIIISIAAGIDRLDYLFLLAAGLLTIVANGKILADIWKSNPRLSGGAITHIGVGLMLIGILFSSGYSRVVSLNNSGLLISRELSEEFNRENLLLFINETRQMAGYKIVYKGERLEPKSGPGYININDVIRLDVNRVVAKVDIMDDDEILYQESDTIEIHPENTYYEVELEDDDGDIYRLYPRIQDNPSMGLAASPSIKRDVGKDLYAHVVNRLSREDVEWNEPEEFQVGPGEQFFLNDYVARVEQLERLQQIEGIDLGPRDVAVKAIITAEGENGTYVAEPLFIIKDNMAARIPDEISDLGIRLTLLNIYPESNTFLLSAETRQKDWIILKAMEKPMINILWLGTLVLMVGFSIATVRRYDEFRKMRAKGLE